MQPFEEDGFPRERCPKCGWIHYHNSRATASAVIVRDQKILLTQRAADPFRGKWDLPGGFLEERESPEEGLRREMREELGIEITVVRLIGVFGPTLYPFGGQEVYNTDIYFETSITAGEPAAGEGSDVANIGWFDPNQLPDIAFPSNAAAIGAWKTSY